MKKYLANMHNMYQAFDPIQDFASELKEKRSLFYVDFWQQISGLYKQDKGSAAEQYQSFLRDTFKALDLDAVFGYNCPDELMREETFRERIPLVAVEGLGHFPHPLPCAWPVHADFSKAYASRLKENEGTEVQKVRLTIGLSCECFASRSVLGNEALKEEEGFIPLAPYFFVNELNVSSAYLVRSFLKAFKGARLSLPWEVWVRPHPKTEKSELITSWAHLKRFLAGPGKDFNVKIDKESLAESLAQTHVYACLDSCSGCDALKMGCEVITVNKQAWYSHPQLTYSPSSVWELSQDLEKIERKIKKDGKRKNPLIDVLEEEAASKLAVPSWLQDGGKEEVEQFLNAIDYAASLPLLSSS